MLFSVETGKEARTVRVTDLSQSLHCQSLAEPRRRRRDPFNRHRGGTVSAASAVAWPGGPALAAPTAAARRRPRQHSDCNSLSESHSGKAHPAGSPQTGPNQSNQASSDHGRVRRRRRQLAAATEARLLLPPPDCSGEQPGRRRSSSSRSRRSRHSRRRCRLCLRRSGLRRQSPSPGAWSEKSLGEVARRAGGRRGWAGEGRRGAVTKEGKGLARERGRAGPEQGT